MKALPLPLPVTDADGVAEMDKGSPVDRLAPRDIQDGSMGILTTWSWLCNRCASGGASPCSQKSHDHKRVYRTSGAVQRIAHPGNTRRKPP